MFWRKKRQFDDFAEEIRSHLEHEADQFQDGGQTREDAEAAARRSFGNVTLVHEEFYRRSRWLSWHRFSRDLRLALRLLRRRPGFSAVVVLTLAVGIGANTAIFSVTNAVLLRPLPYREPDRLAMLWSGDAARGLYEGRVSLLNFADWRGRSRAFEDMTIFAGQTFLLGGKDGLPKRMRSARVAANFFPTLGVDPVLGRTFSADEEQSGEPVVIVSYGLWQREFGGTTQILGSDLIMDGRKSRIIGVMPASFQYPFKDTQVWELMTAHPYWASRDRVSSRSFSIWYVLARLRRGTSWQEARSEMSVIGHQLELEHPENRNLPEIQVVPLSTQTVGRVRLSLFVLFGSVFLMLLIACTNVANLLLAQGSAREREFSVRKALGAGRIVLAAQVLTESLVLAVTGGAAGLGLAVVSLRALILFGPRDFPRLEEAHIDPRVLLFTLLLSLFAATTSALWPAMRTGSSAARNRQWSNVADRVIQNSLPVAEFAISLVLLAGAGLMIRSFLRLQSVDPGFRAENVLVMRIDLHVGKSAEQQVAYFRESIDRVKRLPGVHNAAAVSTFLTSDPEDSVVVEGGLPQKPGPCEDSIEGEFFETAGIPLLKGRTFSDDDRKDSPPVAIINETMARTYWPGEDPIGKRFRFPSQHTSQWLTVVGVAGDMHRQGLEKRIAPQAFLPHAQATDDMMDVIVRTSSDPLALASTIQNAIQSIDTGVAKFKVVTAEQQMEEQTAARRFQTALLGTFAVIALLLSAVGIYGLMHFFVIQRTVEIGIRMALGARHSSVIALVLRRGLTLAVVGIVIGVVGALGMTHVLSSLLYGTPTTDVVTFAAAPLILLAAAVLACVIPARRATRIDPIVALHQD